MKHFFDHKKEDNSPEARPKSETFEEGREEASVPLSLTKEGTGHIIVRTGGDKDTRKFLESLGFVPGTEISVVSEINGSVIVSIRDGRVALEKVQADEIYVI